MAGEAKLKRVPDTLHGYEIYPEITSQELFINMVITGKVSSNRFTIIMNNNTWRLLDANDRKANAGEEKKNTAPMFSITINNHVPDNQIYLNKRG